MHKVGLRALRQKQVMDIGWFLSSEMHYDLGILSYLLKK